MGFGPKPGEHAQLFHLKGFSSQKCLLEASIALCIEWAGYLVPQDVLPSFHNVVARTERCAQRRSDRIFFKANCSLDTGGRGSSSIKHEHQ